jgi:hypothetical protein
MPADPIVPTSPAADQSAAPPPPAPPPGPAAPTPAAPAPAAPPPAAPVPQPAPDPAKAPSWSARAVVPGGAASPGARKVSPVNATEAMPRYADPGYHPAAPRRSGTRRLFIALLAVLLLLAVPVVSAYVSYKLASGENPFVWPPSMDLSHVF